VPCQGGALGARIRQYRAVLWRRRKRSRVTTGSGVFPELPFPFAGDRFPAQLGAVVQRTVLMGELPALEVIHTSDNRWLVGDGVNDPNEPDACEVGHMLHVVERNSSVAGLATLPPGFIATRAGPREQWSVAPHVWPDDEG
jgi:hypothetical protein